MSDTYTPFAPATYNPNEVARQGWGMANSGTREEQLLVAFYPDKVLNKFKSESEGKPVWETRDFITISHPGENLNVVRRQATDQDKQRFARHWDAYQRGVTQVPDGVPLNLLFPSKPHIVETLRGYNIHTIEQLAKLSAHGIGSVGMGCQEWVNAAQKYMVHAEKGVDHHKFETAMAAKDKQIATLTRQLADLAELVNQKTAPRQAMHQTRPGSMGGDDFDYQSEMIGKAHASADPSQANLQPPAQFVQDLSGETRSKPRGRPAGSKNKPKET